MRIREFKPYQIIRTIFGEMEIISYSFPENGVEYINIRLVAGDPTTMRTVRVDDLKGALAAFEIEVPKTVRQFINEE